MTRHALYVPRRRQGVCGRQRAWCFAVLVGSTTTTMQAMQTMRHHKGKSETHTQQPWGWKNSFQLNGPLNEEVAKLNILFVVKRRQNDSLFLPARSLTMHQTEETVSNHRRNRRRHAQILTHNLPLVSQNLSTVMKTPEAVARTPAYTNRLVQCRSPPRSPRIPPPPGPPARTPKPNMVNPIPMRVPTLLLSAVSLTKTTGGRAMKMPEKKP